MPDKHRERFYFAALAEVIPELRSGEVVEAEPPDFIVTAASGRIGVELTVFHLSPEPGKSPHQEQQSLKDEIAARAERIHAESGGAPLYVSAFFRNARLTKRDVPRVSQLLAAAVSSVPAPGHITESSRVPWDQLPPEISHITIHGSIDNEDRLWQADAGGWVAPITSEHVSHVIQKKSRMIGKARTRCQLLWLVIVQDAFSGGAQAEITREALDFRYEHDFDRVIWLLPHAPKALDLIRCDAT